MRIAQASVKLHRATPNQQQHDIVMAVPTSINLGSPPTQHRVEDAKKISPVFPRRPPGNRCEQMPPQGIDDRGFIAHLFLMQIGGAHGGLLVVAVDDGRNDGKHMRAYAKPRARCPSPPSPQIILPLRPIRQPPSALIGDDARGGARVMKIRRVSQDTVVLVCKYFQEIDNQGFHLLENSDGGASMRRMVHGGGDGSLRGAGPNLG